MKLPPRRFFVLLALAGLCPVGLASVSGTPGSAGVPVLTTSPPLFGAPLGIDLASALEGAPLGLFYSATEGPLQTPFGTLGLGPEALQLIASGAVASGGTWAISLPLPDKASLFGAPLNLQAIVLDPGNPTGFALSNSVNTSIWGPDLDVDADRDGTVEFASIEDDGFETQWDSAAGAVFLCNNDDDDSDGVVDHADVAPDGPADELDLAPISLRALPQAPAGWIGRLTVDAGAAPWVRLFKERGTGQGWLPFDPATGSVDTAELQSGLEFRIEALDFAQTATGEPGKWSGEVTLTFALEDDLGLERGRDEVLLRVAPFVLHSNLDLATAVHVTQKSSTNAFIAELAPAVSAAGSVLDPVTGPNYGIWFQDATEFGYSSLPAPGGPRHLPAVLRSPRGKSLDSWCLDQCLSPDFGYVFKGYPRTGVGWIDWFGNLDCTPPLPGWPLGRIYTGDQGSLTLHPDVLSFLEAQGVQAPLLHIDTDWLLIGHVDEEICFVPADHGSPYRMLMPSIPMALTILQNLEGAGHGGLTVFGGKGDQTTVSGILSSSALVSYNQSLQPLIDGVRQTMKSGLGIAEADIIDVPCLFYKHNNRALAYIPNMVNSLVVGNTLISADPFGPELHGVDQFAQPLVQAMGAIGVNVSFVDDWSPYHTGWGEVHCGTNAVRVPLALPWWQL